MLKKIYVFGSKPNTIVPNELSDIVFSANGGAFYASEYLKKFPNIGNHRRRELSIQAQRTQLEKSLLNIASHRVYVRYPQML